MSPKLIATSFSIFINYARRMFPCLMMGSLDGQNHIPAPLYRGMRALRVPQKLIIPISVTSGIFRRSKKNSLYPRRHAAAWISGAGKVEGMVTHDDLGDGDGGRAVRSGGDPGIENPARKTSVIRLRLGLLDWCAMAAAVVFTGAALLA